MDRSLMSVAINTTPSQVTAIPSPCQPHVTITTSTMLPRRRSEPVMSGLLSKGEYLTQQCLAAYCNLFHSGQVDEVVDALSELLRRIPDRVSSKDYSIDTRPFTSISAINE